jgi:hypothetical protein
MSERKMVRRSVAIALGIICTILIAGLGGVLTYYMSTISDKDRTAESLYEINALAKSTVWVNNQTINQTAGNYTSWWYSYQYAGFLVVHTSSTTNNTWVRVIYSTGLPTGNNTILGYNYDNQIDVKSYDEDNVFPILPRSTNFMFSSTNVNDYYKYYYNQPADVEIRIGNTNAIENTNITVSIAYYY